VSSSAIGNVLESDSEVYMGAYSECTWERLESVLGSVEPSRLGVYYRLQLERT